MNEVFISNFNIKVTCFIKYTKFWNTYYAHKDKQNLSKIKLEVGMKLTI